MKLKAMFNLVILFPVLLPVAALADARAKVEMKDGVQTYPPNNGEVCALSGPPPTDIQYEVLARIVATKRTYGNVDELYSPMIREARRIGADAIVNLQVGQKFKGPLPWRITSPTGDGQAIKVLPESRQLDCLGTGGSLWGTGGRIVTQPTYRSASESIESADANSSVTMDAETESEPEVDLYDALVKLDDLRQRGILTDAEFQAEKKKLLDRD